MNMGFSRDIGSDIIMVMVAFLWSLLVCHSVLFGSVQLEITKQETKYVRDGDNMTLSCSGAINATVVWTIIQHGKTSIEISNNCVVTDHEKYSVTCSGMDGVYAVTVHEFNETSDAKKYRCLMSLNFEIQKEVIFTIIIPEIPAIASITGDVPVLAGNNSSMALSCKAAATPSVTFQWRNEGTLIGDNTSSLTLSPVRASDNGANITCTAINTVNSDIQTSDSTILIVYYGAKDTSIQASPSEVSEGDDIKVTCSCHSNPDPTFNITGPTLTSSNSMLEMRNISRSDGGEYNCTAGNVHYMQTRTTTVTVNYPPDVAVIYENATENDTGITITCVAEGKPQSYTFSPWKHIAPDGQTIIRELQGVQNEGQLTLTFPGPVSYEDSGYYECTVNNGVKGRSPHLDQTQMSTYFIIKAKPCTPENETFKAEVRNRNTIEILWTAGCNGGTKQTFHIEYKKTSSQGWILFGTIEENESNDNYSVTISNLEPGTQYDIRIMAKNAKGQSDYIEVSSVTYTEEEIKLGFIIGGTIGVVVAILICVVILFMWRRRWLTKAEQSDMEMLRSQILWNKDEEDVYVNACLGTENDTYEDASLVAGARGDNGACDNAAFTESNETKQLRNKDGLIYVDLADLVNLADLAFAKTNQHQAAPIIHGLEDTTDYAAIDFTKRGPSPPQAEAATAKEETQN